MTSNRASSLIRTAVIATALAASTTAASAQPAFSAEQQRLCTADVFRLCGSERADLVHIVSCMQRHRAELSQVCRAVYGSN